MSEETYFVQVLSGDKWAKVRGQEGGPWGTFQRAERIAIGREASERRPSSTEGLPHRVVNSKGEELVSDGERIFKPSDELVRFERNPR